MLKNTQILICNKNLQFCFKGTANDRSFHDNDNGDSFNDDNVDDDDDYM